jgi:hypothetical protein
MNSKGRGRGRSWPDLKHSPCTLSAGLWKTTRNFNQNNQHSGCELHDSDYSVCHYDSCALINVVLVGFDMLVKHHTSVLCCTTTVFLFFPLCLHISVLNFS